MVCHLFRFSRLFISLVINLFPSFSITMTPLRPGIYLYILPGTFDPHLHQNKPVFEFPDIYRPC
jgi:hypothetical protein